MSYHSRKFSLIFVGTDPSHLPDILEKQLVTNVDESVGAEISKV